MITQERVGDEMVVTTTEKRPAVVNFDDILAAVKIEPDLCAEPPWEACEGYAHEVCELRPFEVHRHRDIENERGYMGRCRGTGWYLVVRIDPKIERSTYKHLREKGLDHKAATAAAVKDRRAAVDQIVKWRRDGWSAWCISGTFHGYTASVCGVYDDDGDYTRHVAREIAREIAQQMRDDGYTIAGLPDEDAARQIALILMKKTNDTGLTWEERVTEALRKVALFGLEADLTVVRQQLLDAAP